MNYNIQFQNYNNIYIYKVIHYYDLHYNINKFFSVPIPLYLETYDNKGIHEMQLKNYSNF